MAIIREKDIRQKAILETAERMAAAARTAPKGKGRDTIEIIIATGDTIDVIAKEMHRIGDEFSAAFFHRDAGNLKQAGALVIIGTEIKTLGLNEMCQLCGFKNCAEKEKYPDTPCVFNTGDLNLAIGSAVAVAAEGFIDNRIMFTIGKAAMNLGLFERNVKIAHGIPLSVTSKNPFFDRK